MRTREIDPATPEIVVLCGSTRFKDAWYAEGKRLTYEGRIVLSVGDLDPNESARSVNVPITDDLKAMLDALHKQKIRLADRVHVLNVGGYIGQSTRSEIAFAEALGRPVTFMERAWRDRHGDVWTLGDDGMLWTPETAPFPCEHVEKKWGPLVPVTHSSEPEPTREGA